MDIFSHHCWLVQMVVVGIVGACSSAAIPFYLVLCIPGSSVYSVTSIIGLGFCNPAPSRPRRPLRELFGRFVWTNLRGVWWFVEYTFLYIYNVYMYVCMYVCMSTYTSTYALLCIFNAQHFTFVCNINILYIHTYIHTYTLIHRSSYVFLQWFF